MTISELITTQDYSESIRDRIALILSNESASQIALAQVASVDPEPWTFKVLTQADRPVEHWASGEDRTSVINVKCDSSIYDPTCSDLFYRQTSDSVFFIDCFCIGVAKSEDTGQTPGDQSASARVQRLAGLVRKILMSQRYYDLDMQGVVGRRFIKSINHYDSDKVKQPLHNIKASRIILQVRHNEFSPQMPENLLEVLNVKVTRSEDGFVLAEKDFTYGD